MEHDTATAEHQPSNPQALRVARLPIHFCSAAVIFFAVGVAILPTVTEDLSAFFYQPRLLAAVHTFTLGWITMVMMGVMYRYVPALTKCPLWSARLGLWQFILFVIGTSGMIAHFLVGAWVATWLTAGIIVLSLVLFSANMVPCLVRAADHGVAEQGMLLALGFLLAAALFGLLLGIDKSYEFLGGNVLTNIAAHAHLAALGWVSLTICAVSYRMLPAFLLPTIKLPKVAVSQIYGLAVAITGLVLTLLLEGAGAWLWGLAVVGTLLSYIGLLARLVVTRRMPITWTIWHAMAGLVSLLGAAGLGVTLTVIDPGSELGNRVAGAYGVLGLLGWMSNFIIGMSYQLFPGFITGVRGPAGWSRLSVGELAVPATHSLIFIAFNAGIVLFTIGLLAGQASLVQWGTLSLAGGGLLYASVTAWALSFAYLPVRPPA